MAIRRVLLLAFLAGWCAVARGADMPPASLEALMARRAADFVRTVNDGSDSARVAFAREHLESRLAAAGLELRATEGLLRDVAVHGPVTDHRIRIVGDGRALFIYVKRERSGAWQNYQYYIKADDGHRLQPVFIAVAVEPMERPATPIDHPETARWLDAFLDAMEEQQPFNGVVLVQAGGREVYVRARGITDAGSGAPLTRDSRLNTASGAKMFTAVATLQLVQAGRLSLDDTVADLLPDFPRRDWAEAATVSALLSHTAGAGNYWDDEYVQAWAGLTTTAGYLPHVLRHLGETPAGAFSYSNSGYIILGLIIEKVTGRSFFEHVQSSVFAPAGMTATGYPLRSSAEPGVAGLYDPVLEGGAVKRGAFTPAAVGERGSPAGGAATTVDDMARFVRAIGNGTLLDAAHRELLTTARVAMDDSDTESYGCGTIVRDRDGMVSWGHGGMGPGTQFECRYYPAVDVLVVVMSNLDTVAAHELSVAIDDIVRAPVRPAPGPGRD